MTVPPLAKTQSGCRLNWGERHEDESHWGKFTDTQEALIIRQGEEDTPVADICRDQLGDLLQLEEEVRRHDVERDRAAVGV